MKPPAAPGHARRPGMLVDSHGRTIHDLRLSITDRCNFRCVYCMDPNFRYMPKRELLTLDEYVQLVRTTQTLGIRKLRITGGEPTLYAHLDDLLRQVGRLGLEDIAITTNGSTLDDRTARRWKQHGVTRVTFSLDTLREDRIAKITRARTSVAASVRAIQSVQRAGLSPIKVNAVIMRGVNDDEVADFADFAREHNIDMRFIEWMPLDSEHAWNRQRVVGADEMLDAIRARHDITEAPGTRPDSTSMNYTFADGALGRIGIIAPVTRPFCRQCSRLRITADGKIRPCLFSHDEWDVRPLLRSDETDEQQLADFIVDSVWTKQAGHGINASDFIQPQRTMSAIGG